MDNITRFHEGIYLEKLFPTVIGIADCTFINDIQNPYKEILKTIPSDDDSELKYYQIHKDEKFDQLTEWITNRVQDYANEHNFPGQYKPFESWCIDYKVGSYNPAHMHTGSTISTSFYLEGYTSDVPISFRGPYFNDMNNPLKITPKQNGEGHHFNELTSPSHWYYPLSGRLLIFRSFTEHEVDKKVNNDNRIVISMNFKEK